MDKLAWAALIAVGLAVLSLVGAVRGGGIFGRVRKLAGAGVFGAAGVLLAALYGTLHACSVFSGETLVGTVRTRPAGSDAFELVYEPAKSESAAAPKMVKLRGDQWVFSGAIVKWHPLFGVFGVRSYHRPLRLGGQFSDIAKQRKQPPTVEAIGPGRDALWEALYWAGPKLPFLEAVYGSSAYGYVQPGTVHEIYVTPSGYMIKRRLAG